MNTETFMVGVHLMVIGMGTVFVFLMIMIFVMKLTHKVILFLDRYYPEEISGGTSIKKIKTDDSTIAIAIACAFKRKNN